MLSIGEEPDDLPELFVIQLVSDPVLVDQLGNVTVPGSTGCGEWWSLNHRLTGASSQ